MPRADTTLPTGAAGVAPAPVSSAHVSGWGGGRGASVRLVRPGRREEFAATLERWCTLPDGARGAIVRGMGRSYGDAAQLDGGLVIETTRLKGVELDAERGVVTAEAGITLGELLGLVVPEGWMVPVVPGTQHVTVGGAIASDIHGKNHGTAGTFGIYVESLGLLTSDLELLELSANRDDRLFGATIGGMGLTGVILWARIRLRPISSPLLSVDTDRVESLDDALSALTAPGGAHRVAWLDLLCSPPGRGIVTRAEHLAAAEVPHGAQGAPTVKSRAGVPASWPGGLLRPATVGAFNELRFRTSPRTMRGHVESIGSHMFPLDALDAWPRLYGREGFVQYQLVVPFGADGALRAVIDELRDVGVPCYLAVLKDFGDANGFPLSFPIAGWTLALDLPRVAPGLGAALDRCDQLVAEAGGRVYLTKDARMRPETLRATYPRLEAWREARERADPRQLWRSDLAERTGLVARGYGVGRPVRAASGVQPGPGSPAGGLPTRVLLLGGTSEIGLAIVRRLAAQEPVRPYLIGRDRDGLTSALAELERSGCAGGDLDVVDADDLDSHAQVVAAAFERVGGFDVVVLAIGVLGAQAGLDSAREEAIGVMRTNFVGSGSLLLESLARLREQGSGRLVVLSSVAAERPRASNPIYGAAKAGLDALAQGLADATADSGVGVLVVRPGFVTTRMTARLKPAPMATTAEAVAEATVRALGGRAHTIWVPSRLRLVFAVLRHLPRALFRRLPV